VAVVFRGYEVAAEYVSSMGYGIYIFFRQRSHQRGHYGYVFIPEDERIEVGSDGYAVWGYWGQVVDYDKEFKVEHLEMASEPKTIV